MEKSRKVLTYYFNSFRSDNTSLVSQQSIVLMLSFFQEKAQEDVSKHLVSITTLLFGADSEQQSDIALAQLSQEMYNSGLLLLLLKNLHKIDFEVGEADKC